MASTTDRSYVGRVERGSENVTLDRIEAFAHALKVPVGRLFVEPKVTAKPPRLRAGRKRGSVPARPGRLIIVAPSGGGARRVAHVGAGMIGGCDAGSLVSTVARLATYMARQGGYASAAPPDGFRRCPGYGTVHHVIRRGGRGAKAPVDRT